MHNKNNNNNNASSRVCQYVEAKYEDMVLRKHFLTRREQLTLRKRMNTSYKTTSLPGGVRDKYEKLAAASLSSHGMECVLVSNIINVDGSMATRWSM